MMVIPWLADDMRGKARNTTTPSKRLLLAGLTLISMLGVFFARPVFLLLLSQAGISVVMPMALLGLIWLTWKNDLLGEFRPSRREWLLLTLIAAFSIFMSSLAVRGLFADVGTLFSSRQLVRP